MIKRLALSLAIFSMLIAAASPGAANPTNLAKKFDEYGYLPTDDEAARLDAFYNELQAQPNLRGYIIGYNQPRFFRGRFLRRLYGDKRYLTEIRGLEMGRVEVIDGGYKKEGS